MWRFLGAADDLPNLRARPESYEGIGLAPDVESVMDEAILPRAIAAKPEERLAIDVQLRTAKELVLREP